MGVGYVEGEERDRPDDWKAMLSEGSERRGLNTWICPRRLLYSF